MVVDKRTYRAYRSLTGAAELAASWNAAVAAASDEQARAWCAVVERHENVLPQEMEGCRTRLPPPPLAPTAFPAVEPLAALFSAHALETWDRNRAAEAVRLVAATRNGADEATLTEIQRVTRPAVERLLADGHLEDAARIAWNTEQHDLHVQARLALLGHPSRYRHARGEKLDWMLSRLEPCRLVTGEAAGACQAWARPLIDAWVDTKRYAHASRLAIQVGLYDEIPALQALISEPIVAAWEELEAYPAASEILRRLAAPSVELPERGPLPEPVPPARLQIVGPLPDTCASLAGMGLVLPEITGPADSPFQVTVTLESCVYFVDDQCTTRRTVVQGVAYDRTYTDWRGDTFKVRERTADQVLEERDCQGDVQAVATVWGTLTRSDRRKGVEDQRRGELFTLAGVLGSEPIDLAGSRIAAEGLRKFAAGEGMRLREAYWREEFKAGYRARQAGQRETALEHLARAWLLGDDGSTLANALARDWGLNREILDATLRRARPGN